MRMALRQSELRPPGASTPNAASSTDHRLSVGEGPILLGRDCGLFRRARRLCETEAVNMVAWTRSCSWRLRSAVRGSRLRIFDSRSMREWAEQECACGQRRDAAGSARLCTPKFGAVLCSAVADVRVRARLDVDAAARGCSRRSCEAVCVCYHASPVRIREFPSILWSVKEQPL